jgi:uncharacterized protein
MDYLAIIKKHYKEDSDLYNLLVNHSRQVSEKALKIASRLPELVPDLIFIAQAAMLHDIGIKYCNAPDLFCHGSEPYIKHGILGRELLIKEGYPKHARACASHTGVGITKDEIISENFPLPHEDLIPLSTEEKIISLADLFFTKYPGKSDKELTIDEIKKSLLKHGENKVKIFEQWCKQFKIKT